jgi:hypothetical protein
VVTREGIPLGYELFAGNRTDVTTVKEVVETMESRYGMARRIWVMDRGMTSVENVAWLKRTGRRYLIGTPKIELRKWSREIVEARDWQHVRDGVEAKPCQGPDGEKTVFCCADRRNAGRRSERSRRRLDRDAIHEQIGRLRERYSRAAGRYEIRCGTKGPSGSERTSSCASWPTSSGRRSSSGRRGRAWVPRVLLDELAAILSTDVVLPLADASGHEVRIRCVVRPDKHQAVLLDRLGLRLPERLRIPRGMAEM